MRSNNVNPDSLAHTDTQCVNHVQVFELAVPGYMSKDNKNGTNLNASYGEWTNVNDVNQVFVPVIKLGERIPGRHESPSYRNAGVRRE